MLLKNDSQQLPKSSKNGKNILYFIIIVCIHLYLETNTFKISLTLIYFNV